MTAFGGFSTAQRRRSLEWLLHFFVLAILPLNATAQQTPEWIEHLSPANPGAFLPTKHPALSEFDFGWAFLHAGTGTARIGPAPSANQIRMDAEAHTSGPVRSLFRIDAHFQSLASHRPLKPLHVRQTESYIDECLETTLHFDSQGVVRKRICVPNPKPGTGKPKHFHFSPLFDPFTAYLWLRSQPNRPGDEHQLVLYAGADPYLLRGRVRTCKPLPIGSSSLSAIQIELSFYALDRKLQILPYRKCRSASLWISDSPARRLLRAEADVFVGKIWLQLQPSSLRELP